MHRIICGLKPYPAYKDSGVPWLGEVPEHWQVRRIKTLFRETDDRTGEGGGLLLSLTRARGIVPQAEASNRIASVEDLSKYKVCKPGDLIMNRMQAWSGMFAVSSMEGVISPDYSVFQPTVEIKVHYFKAFFKTPVLVHEFAKRSKGIGSGFNRLYTPDFGAIRIVSPPHPEQTAIVRFLDWADWRIQWVIRVRKKRIKLLEEYKQALIHQAVTGQIDVRTGKLYPKYKDSGVEWLGKVPEHWSVRRNGIVFMERKESGREESPILAVSLRTGVEVVSEVGEDGRPRKLINDRTKYRQARRGDIAYNTMRMWQGAVGVVPTDGLISPAYVVAKPLGKNDPGYFASLFRTQEYRSLINRYSTGIVSDRNRLYWEDFKQLPSPIPPCAEQQRIAGAIDRLKAEIDRIRISVLREIELLREYRTRLIADVVTGKLDVREVAASLPDEAGESEPTNNLDELEQANCQDEPDGKLET